ncbi:MAG: Radical domain protein [Moraxellaceae bacterium]|jgi:radical SAM superfamily enzyme YgiQ (UPF0313 family)|nr:Radical domain protein [Moraxellaceae bacterium]
MDAGPAKPRVENLPTIKVSTYSELQDSGTPQSLETVRPFTVLLIKPYQQNVDSYGPPLGLLMLVAGLRKYFGSKVTVHFWDMKIHHIPVEALASRLDEYKPDVIGVSTMNFEAATSYEIARLAKQWNPETITVIGGPFTLRQAPLIFSESQFDWIFEGAADRTFLQALHRQFSQTPLADDIAGFSHRRADGEITYNHKQDLITDLDALPLPAWDQIDFERYRRHDRKRIITNIKERKYAFLFTSRGCPYLCTYCHDVFTKRFVYRSEESILEEIRILHEEYGVEEFHIIDDIFNLHRPRTQSIMRAAGKRWPKKLYFAFPNGLRGDILDSETIDAMVEGGTYHAAISIETVSPRLQKLVEKNLDIDRAKWAIDEFHRRGVLVQGAFMLGFPTETLEEIKATIDYAVKSPLMHCFFFAVVPQPNTPIHELAMKVCPDATNSLARDERMNVLYGSRQPWYSRAYGHDLHRTISNAYVRFYLYPPRLFRLLCSYPLYNLVYGMLGLMKHILVNSLGLPLKKLRKVEHVTRPSSSS